MITIDETFTTDRTHKLKVLPVAPHVQLIIVDAIERLSASTFRASEGSFQIGFLKVNSDFNIYP